MAWPEHSDPAKAVTPVSCSGLLLFIRAPNFPSELEGISSADCRLTLLKYRARKNGLQNVISTTQAGSGRLV